VITPAKPTQTIDFRGMPVEISAPADIRFAAIVELLTQSNGARGEIEAILRGIPIALLDVHGAQFWPPAEE